MACFSGISSLNACEILALTNALSVALSEGLSTQDLNALGNLLVSIGSVVLTFASLSPPTANKSAGKQETTSTTPSQNFEESTVNGLEKQIASNEKANTGPVKDDAQALGNKEQGTQT